MKNSDDVICKYCEQVFCCSECRYKHEVKNHAIIVRKLVVGCENKSENTTFYFCPICEGRPLVLYKEMYKEVLNHIEAKHLPLYCQKCAKAYTKLEDLKEFSKCGNRSTRFNAPECCALEQCINTKSVVIGLAAQASISTQTSPMLCQGDFNGNQTPTSMMSLRWKTQAKMTRDQYACDSSSSIKNFSSINASSIRRSNSVECPPPTKGKLVRSTSTPVHAEVVPTKPRDQAFEASGGPVSSIYNSGSEPDISPAVPLNGSPSKQQSENLNRHRKFSGHVKMTAVTPLRQVMSKSIQKAFAQHGLPSTSVRRAAYTKKSIFDTNEKSTATSLVGVYSGNSPIDLRLSPAIRRTRGEVCSLGLGPGASANKSSQAHRGVLLASKKLTTESIIITRMEHLESIESSSSNIRGDRGVVQPNCSTNANDQSSAVNGSGTNSIYKTCHSVEIITSTELNEVNIQGSAYSDEECHDQIRPLPPVSQGGSYNVVQITPITRVPNALIHKKMIRFETPKPEENRSHSPANDIFYTPNTTPIRDSYTPHESLDLTFYHKRNVDLKNLKRASIRDCVQAPFCGQVQEEATVSHDDVFLSADDFPRKPQNNMENHGRLWSLVSSVMRLGSLKVASQKAGISTAAESESKSILKRCASIAGSLIRSKPYVDEDQLQSLKRKRTYTMDDQLTLQSAQSSLPTTDHSNTSSKRFRIQGRKPIERLRINT